MEATYRIPLFELDHVLINGIVRVAEFSPHDRVVQVGENHSCSNRVSHLELHASGRS